MSKQPKHPKRLRLKPFCHIDGLIRGQRLGPGLYVRGQNVDEETFARLLTDEFQDLIELLQAISKPSAGRS